MREASIMNISNFYVVGINYRKADAEIRGQFAVNNVQCSSMYSKAPAVLLNEFFILSTCNRTEVYGFANSPSQLIELLCSGTRGSSVMFRDLCYIHRGAEAIDHLFTVAAGLDSQLLGDYEIVGQIRSAIKYSREHGLTGAFTDRLVNEVLQASKKIKNNTNLSGGAVSVSFAAIQYIRENVIKISDKKILLLGIGKLGRNTSKNLANYLGTNNITLINRTAEKAVALAETLNLRYAAVEELEHQIRKSDIIIVATNAGSPLILPSQVRDHGDKLIIDLSIPCNVAAAVKELPGITLVNVDQLLKRKDENLQKRKADIPKALAIISEHIQEFNEWLYMRRQVPVLKAVKTKLREIQSNPLFIPMHIYHSAVRNPDEKIQRAVNSIATKMRTGQQKGCHYIEVINEFINSGIEVLP